MTMTERQNPRGRGGGERVSTGKGEKMGQKNREPLGGKTAKKGVDKRRWKKGKKVDIGGGQKSQEAEGGNRRKKKESARRSVRRKEHRGPMEILRKVFRRGGRQGEGGKRYSKLMRTKRRKTNRTTKISE